MSSLLFGDELVTSEVAAARRALVDGLTVLRTSLNEMLDDGDSMTGAPKDSSRQFGARIAGIVAIQSRHARAAFIGG